MNKRQRKKAKWNLIKKRKHLSYYGLKQFKREMREFQNSLQAHMFKHLQTHSKIPATEVGVAMLKESISNFLNEKFQPPPYKMWSEPMTDNDRATRQAPIIHIEPI